MTLRVLSLGIALGLALGLATEAPAQQRRTAAAPTSLWSMFGQPTVERFSKAVKPKQATAAAESTQIEMPSASESTDSVPPTIAEPPETLKIDTSSFESAFSAVHSSRRSAIQERQSNRASATPNAGVVSAPAPKAASVTPHWTPRYAVQAALLQLPDDDSARPVAVTMAGELLSERVTAARAVARMDATLNVGLLAVENSAGVPSASTSRVATATR